jgi:predicted nucleotidyltransferase
MGADDRSLDSSLADCLRDSAGVVSAYLFGSVAEGRAHRESDLDVGVLLDWRTYPSAADRFDARLRLIGGLRSAARRDVDLVVLNDAPPQLVRHIMTRGRRLVVFDAEADHDARRTALLRAADIEPFLQRARRVKLAAFGR